MSLLSLDLMAQNAGEEQMTRQNVLPPLRPIEQFLQKGKEQQFWEDWEKRVDEFGFLMERSAVVRVVREASGVKMGGSDVEKVV